MMATQKNKPMHKKKCMVFAITHGAARYPIMSRALIPVPARRDYARQRLLR